MSYSDEDNYYFFSDDDEKKRREERRQEEKREEKRGQIKGEIFRLQKNSENIKSDFEKIENEYKSFDLYGNNENDFNQIKSVFKEERFYNLLGYLQREIEKYLQKGDAQHVADDNGQYAIIREELQRAYNKNEKLRESLKEYSRKLNEYLKKSIVEAIKNDDLASFTKAVKSKYLDPVFEKQAQEILIEAAVQGRYSIVQSILDSYPNLNILTMPLAKDKTYAIGYNKDKHPEYSPNVFHFFQILLSRSNVLLQKAFSESSGYFVPDVLNIIDSFNQDKAKILCALSARYIDEQLKSGKQSLAMLAYKNLVGSSNRDSSLSKFDYYQDTLSKVKNSLLKYGSINSLIESTKHFKYTKKDIESIMDRYYLKFLTLFKRRDAHKAIEYLSEFKKLEKLENIDGNIYQQKLKEIYMGFLDHFDAETLEKIKEHLVMSEESYKRHYPIAVNMFIYRQLNKNLGVQIKYHDKLQMSVLKFLNDLKLHKFDRQQVISDLLDKVKSVYTKRDSTVKTTIAMLDLIVKAHNEIRKSIFGKPSFLSSGSSTADALEDLIREITKALPPPYHSPYYLIKDTKSHVLVLNIPKEVKSMLDELAKYEEEKNMRSIKKIS